MPAAEISRQTRPSLPAKGASNSSIRGIVAPLFSAQREAQVAPDMPVVEWHGARVTVGMVADQADGPRADAGQRTQPSRDPIDVVDRGA